MQFYERKMMGRRCENGRVSLVKLQVLMIALMLITLLTSCGGPDVEKNLGDITKETSDYVQEATPNILPGSIGGEWALLGVKNSGAEISPAYEEAYLKHVENLVVKNKGVLSEDKYTEYARTSIGILACGKDPTNFAGYNLIKPLDNYDAVAEQGVNAMDFALIASKMAGVKLDNQQKYIDYIVKTINDGEFKDDDYASDYLAMNVEALSLFKDDEKVKKAIDKAVKELSKLQKDDGSMGNCDSTCETIIALSQIGKDVFTDEAFIKDGKNLADGLMKFRLKDNSFVHTTEEKEANGMSTEKALLALDSIKLNKDGKRLF